MHCKTVVYRCTLKTREKPTTDFVFGFSRDMKGQNVQISFAQKVCQNVLNVIVLLIKHTFVFCKMS